MANVEHKRKSNWFFRIAFLLFLPVFIAIALSVVQQIQRLTEIEKQIPERIAKHEEWVAARRAKVKSMDELAEKAAEEDRDRLQGEATRARKVLNDAIATEQAEIMSLWNEAVTLRSRMPRPVFSK